MKLRSIVSSGLIALILGTSGLFASTAVAAPPDGNTMGKSHSNPDGGGVDKPYDADGQNAETQGTNPPVADGNNGCGQEKQAGEVGDEFGLDDNNGNCGNKHLVPDVDDDGGDDGEGVPD